MYPLIVPLILLIICSPNGGLGSGINSLGNQDLEWETTKQLNIGVDLGILKNKFTLTADYFHRKTDNLILNVSIPPSFGYLIRGVRQNVGSMENNGFEFLLGYHDRAGDFRWDATANASFIKNKVLKLAPGFTNIDSRSRCSRLWRMGCNQYRTGTIYSIFLWVYRRWYFPECCRSCQFCFTECSVRHLVILNSGI